MRATVVFAGIPEDQLALVVPRLLSLGACVLGAGDAGRAREHLHGGAVDALVVDEALSRDGVGLGELLDEARRRGVLVVGVGAFDGKAERLAARLDKPLEPAALTRTLSNFLP